MLNKTNQIFQTLLNRTYIRFILICLLLATIYLLLSPKTTSKNIQILPKQVQTQPNAFIITAGCDSLRFNATKENIERVFPDFFNILCYLNIPLNDSRIHTRPVPIWKKFSSNLLAFVDIWTYQIPKHSKNNELEWSFIFEDDINFNDPAKVSLPNYITALQELMHHPEVQLKHGFIYLGICGPSFSNDSHPLIAKNTNNSLISQQGYGYCLHASGITAKRSRFFWTAISSYRPG